jgi:diamine N-acetyltransferase
MEVTIRAAAPGDEQRLAVLNGFVQGVHVANRPDNFKPSIQGEVAEWFRVLLQDTSARIWIAEEAGACVGYVVAIVRELSENPFCRSRRWCEIDQIAVDPVFRRKGVASALIQEAVMSAAAQGLVDVELTTWSFNEEAQSVFRKLGFVPKIVRWEQGT